jgi:membrane fusion protein, multidrug efflux system
MHSATILLSIALLFLVSCSSSEKGNEVTQVQQELSTEITQVTTTLINRSDFKREIISQGTLNAVARVEISCTLDEPIVLLNISNGKAVKKNEVLVKIEDSDIQRKLHKLELSLEKIKREREKLLIAKLGYGFSTGDSVRIPADILNMVNMDVGFREKLLEIEEAEAELRDYTIRAPIPGRIADLNARVMNPPSGDVLFTIIDDQTMEADFPILETHFRELRVGDVVRITPLATGEDHRGKISQINPRVSAGGMIQVKATVSNRSKKLIDGMKCKIAVEKIIPNQLVIPKSAMVMRDNRKVMFYYEEGLAYWQYIATPFENSSSYAVSTEEGGELPEGKEVIISGNMNLAHESKVEKTEE